MLQIAPTADQGRVAQVARDEARQHLRARRRFVWNATNTTVRHRRELVRLFADYGARVRIVYVDAAPGTAIARQAGRARRVPAHVITQLAAKLEVPDTTEAHRVEWVVGAEVGQESSIRRSRRW